MKPYPRQAGRKRWRWIAGALLALTLLPVLYLWWLLLSPGGYSLPAGFELAPATGEQQVFVYGTLRNALVRRLVLGRPVATEEAFLPDYRKQGLDIEPQPGAGVHGEVLTLEPPGLRRLDRYERLGIRYERVQATLGDGRQVWVYRRLPQWQPAA
ncbi:gamma-glutamylcyclotransferase family protein [Haliea sp. E1-2-M8]|uniref:gamma-glutamylcyclotransferase family protein n=1 Tax=Haliea sp. E1-2-M8 TaxID=3064706 RepID=UPI0027280569|nr:gamma-glutamylcyclotransferase family protein [Haliea sp. E1-2-M8]MDO8863403.1 gamma-glutamylcyclotransferase family protein [Haliea sp. E1-2-M8]